MDKMRELVDRLNKYRDAYYNNNESLVSDKEYDELFDELSAMEQETGIVYANSPTATVGYEAVSKLVKVTHNHPLLSLGKTTDVAEFAAYFDGRPLSLMGKMDGLTASLTYRGGLLISAETRGNGETGEVITHTARTFVNLPGRIPFGGEVILDGECIIDYDTFEAINQRENTGYKNPRNLVSGTVRLLDSQICARRNVRFIAWKLHSAVDENGESVDVKTYSDAFRFMSSLGFEVVPHGYIENNFDSEEVRREAIGTAIDSLRGECAKLRYPIDGIVGAFDDVQYGLSLGSTGHHPKHSLAFKFYQDRNETVLRDIEWNTNRTGTVNPVAIFDPVEIDGTTVSRASLNNVSIIRDLELGLGDTITVIKANQIIPQVTDNLTRSNSYEFPAVCGCCGHTLEVRNDNGREILMCVNPECPAIRLDQISYFVSRDAMNVMGLSEEGLKQLLEAGLIRDYVDIYHLAEHREELLSLERRAETGVDSILQSIEASRNCRLANVLTAIGLPKVGKNTARDLAEHCFRVGTGNPLRTFLDLALSGYDWTVLPDIGKITTAAINDYVSSNLHRIEPLIDLLNIAQETPDVQEPGVEDSGIFGKTFCITGKLLHFANRNELAAEVEQRGGSIVRTVSSGTDYLITNDQNSGSTKNQAAAKHGTVILSEDDFLALCREHDEKLAAEPEKILPEEIPQEAPKEEMEEDLPDGFQMTLEGF